jgi:predicted MFS family arabinose efflux permease
VGEASERLGQLAAAVRHPGIRRLQLAWTGCITAELAAAVGLAVVAHRLGGLGAVGLLGLIRSLPAAALGPFVASVAERRDHGRVLVAVLSARAALLALAVLVVATPVPDLLVFVVAAADALVYSAWWPTHSALVPQLATSPDQATAANVATTVIENLGTLVGPLVGAALLALSSPTAIFAVAAALLAAGAVVAAPLAGSEGGATGPEEDAPPTEGDGDEHAGALAGFRVALRSSAPRAVIGLYLVQTFALGVLGTLLVAVAVDLLDVGDEGIGLLNAAVGAGGLLGALASVALVGRGRLGRVLAAALVAWGAALLVAGGAPALVVVVPMLALLGACNAVVDVAALTLLQRVVPDAVLVRVLGVFEGLWWAMLGLGAVAGAALADATGPRAALLWTGALLPAVTLGSLGALRRLDAVGGPPPAVLDRLRAVPFFAPLSPTALERLAFSAAVEDVACGQVVVRAGDPGDAFYVIAAGSFEVEVGVDAEGGRRRRLGPEASFGEVALLRDVPRSATVRAATDGRLLRITRGRFLEALRFDPSMHELARTRADRLLARQARRQPGRAAS